MTARNPKDRRRRSWATSADLIAEFLEFLSLLAVLVLLGLLGCMQSSHAATPMQWSDSATYYGPAGTPVTLVWLDANEPPGTTYEVRAKWLERPTRVLSWTLTAANVTRTKVTAGYSVSWPFKAPGAGHFSFEWRSCWLAPIGCTTWTSSLDPSNAKVVGVARAWWLYQYTAAPGPIVTVPTSTPTGPEK